MTYLIGERMMRAVLALLLVAAGCRGGRFWSGESFGGTLTRGKWY